MITSALDLKEIGLKPIEFLDYQESIVRLKNILNIEISAGLTFPIIRDKNF